MGTKTLDYINKRDLIFDEEKFERKVVEDLKDIRAEVVFIRNKAYKNGLIKDNSFTEEKKSIDSLLEKISNVCKTNKINSEIIYNQNFNYDMKQFAENLVEKLKDVRSKIVSVRRTGYGKGLDRDFTYSEERGEINKVSEKVLDLCEIKKENSNLIYCAFVGSEFW